MKNKKCSRTIIYDDNCPLCSWYTGAFVQSGLLAEEGRLPFSSLPPELLQQIDYARGKNEIPLIDHQSGKVLYGIDALVSILGQRCPIVRLTGRWKPVNWLLKKLYNFISYNRKVIVARSTTPGTVDCTPDFRLDYRVVFMLVFLVFNTIMLFPVHSLLLQKLPYCTISLVEFHVVHAVIVLVNCLLALTLPFKKGVEYLGQVNMLALITLLLLLPLMALNNWVGNLGWFNYVCLAAVTVLVVEEYVRRMHYAGILLQYEKIVAANFISLFALVGSLFVL